MGHNKSRIVFSNCPEVLDVTRLSIWLNLLADQHGFRILKLNYVFVSREKIVEINKRHLSHNYATDIISFDYSSERKIKGEIIICQEVVFDNAIDLKEDNRTELLRVVCHGLLHLFGYNDKSVVEGLVMREKEDECLQLFMEMNG